MTTKAELKLFIATLDDDICYTNFRSEVAKKISPAVIPKEWYYRWYGVFKDLKRFK